MLTHTNFNVIIISTKHKAVTPTKNEPPPIKKKGTARTVKVKDMFRAFILTLVEAYESNEDTYGYTYWDIVRGIRMANERHAITDGEVDSLCYKMNCTRYEMLTA